MEQQTAGTSAKMTPAQMQAYITKLEADNAKLQTKRSFTLKVSTKGAVSAYGLGRFPVTLYGGQWEEVIKNAPKIQEFLKANAASLAVKA